MKKNENKDGYLQPVCELCRFEEEHMIATSGQGQTETLDEEDFQW